jgi:hypothetical protein
MNWTVNNILHARVDVFANELAMNDDIMLPLLLLLLLQPPLHKWKRCPTAV